MKEKQKTAASRFKKLFAPMADEPARTRRSDGSEKPRTVKAGEMKQAGAKQKRSVADLFRGVLRYRFAISCAAVVILTAIVLGVLLGGAGRSGAEPGRDNIIAANETPVPKATDDPGSARREEPTKVPNGYAEETFPPIETPEPYVPSETPVPATTAIPIDLGVVVDAKFGEHNDLIPSVQERLMVLWYMDQDEPTDYFGRITKGALEAFQRRSELPVTGELDLETYTTLFDDGAKAYLCSVGDTGGDVQSIEDRLYELGYLDKADDTFDEVTFEAVKDFQQTNDLDVDGKVGRNTKEALYDPEAVPKAWTIGDSGEQILNYQNRLTELGYLTTEPDGIYGTDTQMAVRRFQAQNELIVDGYLGPTTRERLMSEDAVGNALSLSMQGSDVLHVQQRLYHYNYMRAQDVNSYYTTLTEQAVRLFQQNNHLQVDGKVGRNTMRVLMSDDAVRASSPVTPPSNNNGNNSGNNGNNGNGNGNGDSVEQRINRFISVARSKLGCRYVRGGKGPNVFDCSGFVYWVLNHSGVSQGYMTSYMWRSCTRYQRNNNINSVRRGDVIVYYGHVAICSGSWTMIDASSSKGKVVERSFNGNYWHRNFICSFRIFR